MDFMSRIAGMRQDAGLMPTSQPAQTTQQTGGISIPMNLFPSSQSNNLSSGGSSSSQSSTSGINWDSPVASGILDQLMQAANGLPGVVNNMGETLQGQYSNLMNQAMGPQAFQGTLNNMGAKNMLNSSVTGDAMAKAQQMNAQQIGNQAFNSMLAQQSAQMQLPGLLGQVAQLGQESSSSSQSRGSQSSQGSSYSSNPLAPYELISSMLPTLLNYGIPG